MTTTAAALDADYFDGFSARAVPVTLRVEAGWLHIAGRAVPPVDIRVPLAEVQWPERTRHGARLAHLREGGTLRGQDAAEWDAWARASGIAESPVVAAQQSWRGVLVAVLVLLAVAAAGYVWGVPLMTRAVLASAPSSLDRRIGAAALESLDDNVLLPSAVPAARQRQIRETFAAASERAYPRGDAPAYELQFRTSRPLGSGARTVIGPNAFALPGGTIVVTDEMLDLLDKRDDVLIGVLGHELGHVRLRHGMRLLVQASIIGVAGSIAWGDFSSVFAALPALLGQSAYSRDFEREADNEAIRLLRANQLSPLVMVELFERLDAKRAAARRASTSTSSEAKPDTEKAGDEKAGSTKPDEDNDGPLQLGIALASHPADAERMQTFREAAGR